VEYYVYFIYFLSASFKELLETNSEREASEFYPVPATEDSASRCWQSNHAFVVELQIENCLVPLQRTT